MELDALGVDPQPQRASAENNRKGVLFIPTIIRCGFFRGARHNENIQYMALFEINMAILQRFCITAALANLTRRSNR